MTQITDCGAKPSYIAISHLIGAILSFQGTHVSTVPGRYGIPIISKYLETYRFFKQGWQLYFHDKQSRHNSTVFKANLFSKTIIILDHEGMSPILDWDGRLRKDYGFGWAVPPQAHVGHIAPSVFQPPQDHNAYKQLYFEILGTNAGAMINVFDNTFAEYSQKWAKNSPVSMTDELERFWVSFIFNWYFGDCPNPDNIRFLYNHIFTHQLGFITRWIPGSKYRRSIPIFNELYEFVKQTPKFPGYVEMANNMGLTDESELAKQLLFLTGMNNFLGLQSFSKSIFGEISLREKVKERLKREIDQIQINSFSDIPDLDKCHYLDAVLKEVLRLHPPVFFIYGRANHDFVLKASTGQYQIKQDDHLMGVIPTAQRDEERFVNAHKFDPDRFLAAPGKATSNLIWAHGVHDEAFSNENHTCPGKDVAMILGKLFTIRILKNSQWTLREDPQWSMGAFHLNIAAPEGDLLTDFQSAT